MASHDSRVSMICKYLFVLVPTSLSFACLSFDTSATEETQRSDFSQKKPILPKDTLPDDLSIKSVPTGFLQELPVPDDNPMTKQRIALGRRIFFDPILSKDNTVSCASCHQPDYAFATPDAKAIGIRGQVGHRNSPSLFNRAYGKYFFWDGRAGSLEEQALQPISNKLELGTTVDAVLKKMRKEKSYVSDFAKAFRQKDDKNDKSDYITDKNLAKALATFQRTLLLGDSTIDRFRASQTEFISESERQGLWLYESRGNCWKCHSGDDFTDENFHNTGVSWGKKPLDLGRFDVTKDDTDLGKFKTPTLRGVALTPPYMHDGSIKTLREVVEFYNKGAGKNPHRDPKIKKLNLSEKDIDNLVAFLKALSRSADPDALINRMKKKRK